MSSSEGSAASTRASNFEAQHDRLRGESRLETRIQRLTRNVAVHLGSCSSFAKIPLASSTTPGPSTISMQSWVNDFETLASNSGKGASVYKECLAEIRQSDASVLYAEALCTVEDQLRQQIESLIEISTAISGAAAQHFISDGDICESNLPQEDRERVNACVATLKEGLTALQSPTATEEIGSEVTAIPRQARTNPKRSKTAASSARSLQQKIVDRGLTALAAASDPGKET